MEETCNVNRPSSEDTREAYQALLSVVEQQLGGQPSNVIHSVADEVLSLLKCEENIENPIDKKAEIEKLMMNPIADHLFDEMLLIGKRIRDDSIRENQTEFYQPTTEETRVPYKMLLNVVEDRLRDKPQIVHCMVAHEVLLILNNDSIKHHSTGREMIDNLLNRVSDETYDLLVFTSSLIRDFKGRWDSDTLRVKTAIRNSELTESIEWSNQNSISKSTQREEKGVHDGSNSNCCINGDWKVEKVKKPLSSTPTEERNKKRIEKGRLYREVAVKVNSMKWVRWIKNTWSRIIDGCKNRQGG